MPWGNPKSLSEYAQLGLLSPLAFIYGLGNRLHKFAYDSGLCRSHKLPIPVISVGNITCGGTGKTPIVIDIARYLINKQVSVGILSRGYNRRGLESLVVVGDGHGQFASVSKAGDEPLMIAQAVPQAVVLSSSDRYAAGMQAIHKFGSKVIILDDGYQHYRLQRNLDLVLVDYADMLMKDALLPAGRLREPPDALGRASQIVITKIPDHFDNKQLKRLEDFIGRFAPYAPINHCRFIAKQLHGFISGKPVSLPNSYLTGLNVVAFCGLAKPEGFQSLIKGLGANILATHTFPDHHWYSPSDISMLEAALKEKQAQFFITTEKDFVKIQTSSLKDKMLAVELETQWLNNFPETIIKLMEKQHDYAPHYFSKQTCQH